MSCRPANCPAAITDPFGDGYDYLGTDTSFISEWFELRSNDAYFSIRMPEKTKWEETLTESINGNIKSVQAQVNHARSDLSIRSDTPFIP